MRMLATMVAIACLLFIAGPRVSAQTGKRDKQLAKCETADYECMRVKRRQSWQSLFPDERERDIVMRINHTNQSLYAGKLIKVPHHLETASLLDFAPLPHHIDDNGEKTIIFDPKVYAWGAYDDNGDLIRWGPASGGSDWCRDIERACHTKPGSFRIYSMGSSNCISSKFPVPDGGAPMPYCMFFHGGQALHGSPGEVVNGNVSHGCVRLFVQDAEWLRYDFVDPPSSLNNNQGTKVIVLPYHHRDEDDDNDDTNNNDE